MNNMEKIELQDVIDALIVIYTKSNDLRLIDALEKTEFMKKVNFANNGNLF